LQLKRKEREYQAINNQLLDLEYRFKLLKQDKQESEERAKKKRFDLTKTTSALQNEIVQVTDNINASQDKLKNYTIEVANYKTNLMENQAKLNKLKKKLINTNEDNESLIKDNKILEGELELLEIANKRTDLELLKLKEINATINKSFNLNTSKCNDSISELEILQKKLIQCEEELSLLQKEQLEKKGKIELACENINKIKLRLNEQEELNVNLKADNTRLVGYVKELEEKVIVVNKQLTDTTTLLSNKESELTHTHNELSRIDGKRANEEVKIEDISRESIILKKEIEKYKVNGELYMNLREEILKEKVKDERLKDELEMKAVNKNIEAREAKRELEQMQAVQEQLVNETVQRKHELETLKLHTELLEDQNNKVITPLIYS